jgi:hypothetical protein
MRIAIHPNILLQEVQGEALLLSIDQAKYYELNEVGTLAWKYLTDTGILEDAVQGILGEYQVDEGTLRHDLQAFARDLINNGLAGEVEA